MKRIILFVMCIAGFLNAQTKPTKADTLEVNFANYVLKSRSETPQKAICSLATETTQQKAQIEQMKLTLDMVVKMIEEIKTAEKIEDVKAILKKYGVEDGNNDNGNGSQVQTPKPNVN